MERRRELSLLGLSASIKKQDAYLLLLQDKEGHLRIPIVIGNSEAQAIVIATSDVQPPRPLTHDLFQETLLGYGIEIKEVYINKVVDHIFHAEICCDRFGDTHRFDSRASDAIVLALKFNVPIYTNDEVLEKAGVAPSNSPDHPEGNQLSLLKKKLATAIEKEDYETAAQIRDEIKRITEVGEEQK